MTSIAGLGGIACTVEACSLPQSQWHSDILITSSTHCWALTSIFKALLCSLIIKSQIFSLIHYKCLQPTRCQARSISNDLLVFVPSGNLHLLPAFAFLHFLWFNFRHIDISFWYINEHPTGKLRDLLHYTKLINSYFPNRYTCCCDYLIALEYFSLLHISSHFQKVMQSLKGPLMLFRPGYLRLCSVRAWKPPKVETAQILYTICSTVCLPYFRAPHLWKNPKAAVCKMHRKSNRWAAEEFKGKVVTTQIPCIYIRKYTGKLLRMTTDENSLCFNAFLFCPFQRFNFFQQNTF